MRSPALSSMAALCLSGEQTSRICCQRDPTAATLSFSPPSCRGLKCKSKRDIKAGALGVPRLCCCPMPGGGWASGTPSNPLTQIASGSSPPRSLPGSCMGSNFSASASASAQLSVPLWPVTPTLHGTGAAAPSLHTQHRGLGAPQPTGTQHRPPFAGFFIAGQELQTQRKCVFMRGSPSLWPLIPVGPCSTHIAAKP